jgi:hypothetical protein
VHRENSVLSSERNRVTEHSVRRSFARCASSKENARWGRKISCSRNPLDLSLTKSHKRKECVGDQNLRGDQTQKG